MVSADLVEQTPIMFSLDTPIELVLQMVQRLGLRFVLLTKHGALVGILTKMVRISRTLDGP